MNRWPACLPVAVSRHNIVDLQLLANLLDSKVEGVCLELLAGHVRDDSSGKAHEASGLILGSITPAVTLLTTARAIGVRGYTRLGAATTFQVAIRSIGKDVASIFRLSRVATEPASSQRYVVGTSGSLASPRHLDAATPWKGRRCWVGEGGLVGWLVAACLAVEGWKVELQGLKVQPKV